MKCFQHAMSAAKMQGTASTAAAGHMAGIFTILSRVCGPHDGRSQKALADFQAAEMRVHTPIITPAWGVVDMLSSVSLTCPSVAATIYVSVWPPKVRQGTATPRHQTHQGVLTEDWRKYIGPIVLDQIGTWVVKAKSENEGESSAVVSVRLTVRRP